MDIERGCLDVLFKRIPNSYFLNDIVNGKPQQKNSYSKISKKVFCEYSASVFPHYTINEIENIYEYLNAKLSKDYGVFGFVADVAGKFLTYDESEPQCIYEQILRWRDISFKLGQDLFTCAYLAKIDTLFSQRTEFFAWSPIIKTDNKRLHNILKKGMAENHFHLNGSTQIFALNWASVMNYITNRHKDFKQIDNYMDSKLFVETDSITKKSLYSECMTAAFIRLCLFNCIKSNTKFIKQLENAFKTGDLDVMWVADMQRGINNLKEEYGFRTEHGYLDYALEKSDSRLNNNDNRVLAGERKFLYECFLWVFQDKFNDFQKDCFYVYLIIKNLFRSELIQVNERLGFKNFCLYQDRKEIFIEGFKQYKHELIRMAINSTIKSQNVVSLEARICPKKDGMANIKAIREIDGHAKEKNKLSLKTKPKHFFVLHFPKLPDTGKFADYTPRNSKMRKKVEAWTKSIVQLLETEGKARYRVKGIDACTHEIGCRPEVFAQSFRYLTNFNIIKKSVVDESTEPIKLSATYHAGEDFLDIVDGLRAIDETILFCNLKRGSRLGHALALGINPQDYYELKNYNLVLSMLDIIDDTAWMLEKSKEYGLNLSYSLTSWLENTFYDYCKTVYGHVAGPGENITSHDYYCAWKLRGDKPDIYCKSVVELKRYLNYIEQPLLQSEYYEVNRKIPDSIRENTKFNGLYFAYHFDKKVRELGNRQTDFKVNKEYVHLVTEIQKKMMVDISRKGIAIETNPSSNYLIGTIKKYNQHPIIRFNNLRLETDNERINENPLISVSINTDDQGVFDTMLENEYALLAYALEKSVDENGRERYQPEMVYRWLDNIRNHGIEQVF